MGLAEFYPEPETRENRIVVPLDAFLEMTRAIREIRNLHQPVKGNYADNRCSYCTELVTWHLDDSDLDTQFIPYPCPTLEKFDALDDLREGK